MFYVRNFDVAMRKIYLATCELVDDADVDELENARLGHVFHINIINTHTHTHYTGCF